MIQLYVNIYVWGKKKSETKSSFNPNANQPFSPEKLRNKNLFDIFNLVNSKIMLMLVKKCSTPVKRDI